MVCKVYNMSGGIWMQLKRCDNGHYYDPEKHSSCPHCGVQNLEIDIQKTMAKRNVNADIGKTQPKVSASNTPDGYESDGKTIGLFQKKLGIDPVVGWLVCIKGTEKGKDYQIHSEKNFIGRSDKMDVMITGDDSISRENHAIVSFNPKNNTFKLLPGDGRGLVYLNNDEVLTVAELHLNDIIEIGQTQLMFIPFCGEIFQWKKDEDKIEA